MRSERKIINLRAELEEAVHARKKELAEEAAARKAKGRGAAGAADVAEEESGRRGNSAEDSSGGHWGEKSLETKIRATKKNGRRRMEARRRHRKTCLDRRWKGRSAGGCML